MLKALREAKENTSWVNPNKEYEEAVGTFVKSVLTPGRKNRFLEDFLPFQKYVAGTAIWNSLSQTLLKLTAPGVPDIYQGSELWDLRMVDPDNRSPVNYDLRRKTLDELNARPPSAELVRELLETPEDSRVKLYLISRSLNFQAAKSIVVRTGRVHAPRRRRRRVRTSLCLRSKKQGWRSDCCSPAVGGKHSQRGGRVADGRRRSGEKPLSFFQKILSRATLQICSLERRARFPAAFW